MEIVVKKNIQTHNGKSEERKVGLLEQIVNILSRSPLQRVKTRRPLQKENGNINFLVKQP